MTRHRERFVPASAPAHTVAPLGAARTSYSLGYYTFGSFSGRYA
ncbi:hypothetical protein FHR91_002196 [Erythrobacter lutimaris]|nr:hypothetical protein [Alteriqipengyuania lutimaris]